MRPRGPLPRRIYWTRRVLLVVVAVAVPGFLWWLVPGNGGAASTSADLGAGVGASTRHHAVHRGASPTVSRKPTKATSNPPTAPPTTKPTAPPTTEPTTPVTKPTGPCAPANIQLGVAADSAPPGAGTTVRVTMSTTDGSTCTLGITPAMLETRIAYGANVVWQDSTCPDELAAKNVVVGPHPAMLYSFHWDGYQTADACSRTGDVALPRRYRVVAALIGGEPRRGFFYVTEPNGARH